ncbi:MAG: bifunctional UDP-N-acetylglucosamine diphosphorylase/glucosamine-1-phosphate N-acetyltransferase GlmU, partial [Oscillospiraceae bacterium]|nr:bifunctional UDP-N-acetylglucosamine diphosphorylase/glucosamine-1-phosphate N-acetyltransferase GlmU [Oscillospiraceae bacterium]
NEKARAIKEINTGAYWFNAEFLLSALGELTTANASGEYYLTDTVAVAVNRGLKAGAVNCRPEAALGANDRRSLAALNEIARTRVLDRLMAEGVDIPFPAQVTVGPQVRVGPDTRILPGSILTGETVIGKDCEIGPNTRINDAVVGDGSAIIASFVESSTVGGGVKIGPMSNIRPGCVIGDGVKAGDFVELKNSNIGRGTSVAHLTYVGDADVGEFCNFGCGVVTVNYDGSGKYRTEIGNGAFIGCNTNLIAPIRLGDRVYCAAGTTVTEDVPEGSLVIGRSRQAVKENWNSSGERYQKGRTRK